MLSSLQQANFGVRPKHSVQSAMTHTQTHGQPQSLAYPHTKPFSLLFTWIVKWHSKYHQHNHTMYWQISISSIEIHISPQYKYISVIQKLLFKSMHPFDFQAFLWFYYAEYWLLINKYFNANQVVYLRKQTNLMLSSPWSASWIIIRCGAEGRKRLSRWLGLQIGCCPHGDLAEGFSWCLTGGLAGNWACDVAWGWVWDGDGGCGGAGSGGSCLGRGGDWDFSITGQSSIALTSESIGERHQVLEAWCPNDCKFSQFWPVDAEGPGVQV